MSHSLEDVKNPGPQKQGLGPSKGSRGQQVHDGQSGHGLAAARLAHQARVSPFATAKLTSRTACSIPAGSGRSTYRLLTSSSALHALPSGAVTSRIPSPKRFIPKTRRNNATPGMVIRYGIKKHELLAFRNHQPPGGRGRLDAHSQEGERGFQQDGPPDLQGGHHHQIVEQIGQDFSVSKMRIVEHPAACAAAT